MPDASLPSPVHVVWVGDAHSKFSHSVCTHTQDAHTVSEGAEAKEAKAWRKANNDSYASERGQGC